MPGLSNDHGNRIDTLNLEGQGQLAYEEMSLEDHGDNMDGSDDNLGERAASGESSDDQRFAAGSRRCGGTAGLILMALSAVSFSIMTLIVHVLATKSNIPSFEQVMLRCVLGVGMSLVWTRRASVSIWPERRSSRLLLLARACIGMVGMGGNWFIITQLSLGDATVIIFTSPIFTALLARIVLKERLSWPQVFLLAISAIGVTLVARPSFLGFKGDPVPEYATMSRGPVVMIGLVAAVASAATNILVRKLLDIHAMVTVSWLMAAGVITGFTFAFAVQRPKWPGSGSDWWMLLLVGLLGFAGQAFKTQGLKWELAASGSMMRNLDLVFAFFFQITLLGEAVKVMSLVGALITLASSVSMGILKLRVSRRKALADRHVKGHGTADQGHSDLSGGASTSPTVEESLGSGEVELALALLEPAGHRND